MQIGLFQLQPRPHPSVTFNYMDTTQDRLHRPRVPTEIIHEIIDKLPRGDSGFISTRSNTALASRCCRHRINFHRFYRLEIYVHVMPLHRLQVLAGILCSDLWQWGEGIAQHVKFFSLKLGQGSPGTPPYIQSRDNIISEILKALFTESDAVHKMSIGTCDRFCHYTKNGPYPISGLAFDALGSETIATLHDLYRNRPLNTLFLERMWDVPSSFFVGSTILNLDMDHVHFTTSKKADFLPMLPNLLYLQVKEAPSFVPACYTPLNQHVQTIDRVQIWLRSEEEYSSLFMIGSYATTLEIMLLESEISSVLFN